MCSRLTAKRPTIAYTSNMIQRGLERDHLQTPERVEFEIREEIRKGKLEICKADLFKMHLHRRNLYEQRNRANAISSHRMVEEIDKELVDGWLKERERAGWDKLKVLVATPEEAVKVLGFVSHRKEKDDDVTIFDEAFDFFCNTLEKATDKMVIASALDAALKLVRGRDHMDDDDKQTYKNAVSALQKRYGA